MPIATPNAPSILPATQTSGGSGKMTANKLRYDSQHSKDAALWSATAEGISNFQSQMDSVTNALRQPVPQGQVIQITDPSGNLVAEIGNLTGTNNQAYPGIWGKNIYVGGSGPDTAPFQANGSQVIIGNGGQVFIVDQFNNVGAWLGDQVEAPKTISNVTDCSTVPYVGFVQITVTAHGYVNGDNVNITGVLGVPNANIGMGIIQIIDANNFVLLQTPFSGSYGGGGTSTRFYSGGLFSTIAVGGSQVISNIQDNGGFTQITVTANGYAVGYAVTITDTTGIVGLNFTSWLITSIIDADNFVINRPWLAGDAYDGLGGQSLNWPTAKLIAYDNGDLVINGASITIDSNGVTTVINNAMNPWSHNGASLTSTDNTTGNYSLVDPLNFALLTSSNVPVAYLESFSSAGNQIGQLFIAETTGGATVTIRGDTGIEVSSGGLNQNVLISGTEVKIGTGIINVAIQSTGINSPAYSVSGTPGISKTINYGASLTVGTGSGAFGASLTVNTGSAITSVSGTGVSSTSGTFVTSVTLNTSSTSFVNSVALNTDTDVWTQGLLTL